MTLSIIFIFIPSILGYVSASLCNVKESSGTTVSFRPSPIVFAIVWPILYILSGISWYLSFNKSGNIIPNLVLNLFLCSWIIVYSCFKRKDLAIISLILSILSLVWCMTFNGTLFSKILLIPLLLWLIFATILNITEVKINLEP